MTLKSMPLLQLASIKKQQLTCNSSHMKQSAVCFCLYINTLAPTMFWMPCTGVSDFLTHQYLSSPPMRDVVYRACSRTHITIHKYAHTWRMYTGYITKSYINTKKKNHLWELIRDKLHQFLLLTCDNKTLLCWQTTAALIRFSCQFKKKQKKQAYNPTW